MLLEYLGMRDKAEELENAVKAVYKEGKVLTPDMGGNSKTSDVTEAIIHKLK